MSAGQGWPAGAIVPRRGAEPEVSHAVLAHVFWTSQARSDIASKGLSWAAGHAEGLRIASALSSCTADLMDRAELSGRPNPYLAADAAWAAHENERDIAEPEPAEHLADAVATPFGWAHDVEPFTPNEARVVELSLEAKNLDVLEAMAVDRLQQAIADPYGVLGVDGPPEGADPRAHAAAMRLMAQQQAVQDLPAPAHSPMSRPSSSAPAKSAAKTLRRR